MFNPHHRPVTYAPYSAPDDSSTNAHYSPSPAGYFNSRATSSLSSSYPEFNYPNNPYVVNSAFAHPRYLPQSRDFLMPHIDRNPPDTYRQLDTAPFLNVPITPGSLVDSSSLHPIMLHRFFAPCTSAAVQPAGYTSLQAGFVYPPQLPLEHLNRLAFPVIAAHQQPIPHTVAETYVPNIPIQAGPSFRTTISSELSQVGF
jgi:hypothetical protein